MNFNIVELHLALNHGPLFFLLAALTLFVVTKILKNDNYRKAALILCIVGGALAVPTFLTGDEAGEKLWNNPQFSQEKIHNHEEAGERAMITCIVLAFVVAGAMWREKKGSAPNWTQWAPILLLIVALGSLGYASYIGGMIRHSETQSLE